MSSVSSYGREHSHSRRLPANREMLGGNSFFWKYRKKTRPREDAFWGGAVIIIKYSPPGPFGFSSGGVGFGTGGGPSLGGYGPYFGQFLGSWILPRRPPLAKRVLQATSPHGP